MSDPGDFIIENRVLTAYRGPGGDVTVPEGVIAVGDRAFLNCRGLTRIVLPEGLRRLGKTAFRDCAGLRSAVLPGSLTHIGPRAFRGCSVLRDLTFGEGLKVIGEFAFFDCAGLQALILPEGLQELSAFAFASCAALEKAVLPRSLRHVGRRAFSSCVRLSDVTLPEGVTVLDEGAFANCLGLASIVLPEGLTEIGEHAFFNCAALSAVSLPGSLRMIGDGAFAGCRRLGPLTLPEDLVSIGDGAFSLCPDFALESLPKGLAHVGVRAFSDCRGRVGGDGFLIHRGVLCRYFGSSSSAVVPEGVTRIADGAFPVVKGFTDVRLPESVTEVERGAFPFDRLILRVPRWTPGLTPGIWPSENLFIVTEDAAQVPPRLRRAARLGAFLRGPEDPGGAPSRRELAWYARYASSILTAAFEMPELLRFLCERRLLRPGDAALYLEEARARKDLEQTVRMLEYLNAMEPEAAERARAQQEDAAAARVLRAASRRPEDGIRGLRFAADWPLWRWDSPKELRAWLEARGAKLDPNVSARTDWLVSGGYAPDSETRRRAAVLEIPTLSEAALLAMADGAK